jgi:hypothetical protein
MNTFLGDILLAAGTLVLIVAFITYQVQRIERLKQHGRRIIATITSIRHETGKSFGLTRDNYYVTAKWTNPRTGRSYTFWTWIINSCLSYRQGDLVPVLIDPNHPERYAMVL